MNRLKITKKSFDDLTNRHIGSGIVFIHTGTKEVTSFNFYRAQNGNFYQVNDSRPSTPLAHVFADIAADLNSQEKYQPTPETSK